MMIHPLLPELIQLQRREHWLRPEDLEALGKRLDIPLNRIYSTATFYQAFRFQPCGKHRIQVCTGAACYVKGAETLYDAFAKHLKIPDGSDTSPDGLFTLSKVACLGCCMLAVAVQIDRHIFGHVTPEKIPTVLRDFLRIIQSEPQDVVPDDSAAAKRAEIRICRCSSCRAAGSARIYRAIADEGKKGGFEFELKEVGCHGMSYRAPLVSIADGESVYHYEQVREDEVRQILSNHFSPRRGLRKISWGSKLFFDAFYRNGSCSCMESVLDPVMESARLVTKNSGISRPESIEDYRAAGGFNALKNARRLGSSGVIELLKSSRLRGRGGGGFLTGAKWEYAFQAPGKEKIVICNADEGDPGAFMDRMLLESYPFRVLEGIMIAAQTIGAAAAIIYIREEYAQAVSVLERVIRTLKQAGVFAKIKDGFEIQLFRGAGAFVCGEETALLESIEGRRGIPRKRPPFPVSSGLNGLPTLINNVETFACVSVILADGGAAFNAVGTPQSHGTKAFALAGKVRHGGLIEVPIGISIRDIVEKYGGGAEEGHTIKAVMIGGPSGGCIPHGNFDLPVDYETLQASGAMMGSGGLIVIDERDCMVDLALYFLRFLRSESCGKCVMCREGVELLYELVERLTKRGEKDASLLDEIEQLARRIQQGSLCALGRTAPNMVLSAMHEFRGEFLAHLKNECPAGKCVELTEFFVSDDCIGCSKCAQICAAGAIACEVLDHAVIDPALCVRCGVCRNVCPEHAILNRTAPAAVLPVPPIAPFAPASVPGDCVKIDGTIHPYSPGKTILELAGECGISIPTLCFLKQVSGNAHCMVCAVRDNTLGRFVPACEQLVQKGHVYETSGNAVKEFRRTALELMLRRHDFRCGSCSAKGNCTFFELVKEYGAKKRKSAVVFPEKIRAAHLTFDGGKCVLCHRCTSFADNVLSIHNRAGRITATPFPGSWSDISADLAAELSDICPTGAITLNSKEEPPCKRS